MPVSVLYPKVSLEESRGRISRWLATEGQQVSAGDILFEIDNDKAAVEVASPAAGSVHLRVAEGSLVDVGAEVAFILPPGEPAPSPQLSSIAQRPAEAASPRAAAVTPGPGAEMRGPNPTPLARRLARENGLDLSRLSGTGPRGRVQRRDVLACLAGASAPQAGRGSAMASGAAPLNAVWLRRGQGLPLVMVHGFSADLNNWRGFVAGAPGGMPLLALDLPGHGNSPRDIPPDLDAIAAMIEATLQQEGAVASVLAGHSFGAAAAARVAARGQADVRALCMFAPAGLGPFVEPAFVEGILRARSEASLRPWLQQLVHDPAVISEAFVKAAARQRDDEGLIGAMRAFAERFLPDGTQAVSVIQDLRSLRVPARIVAGRQDRIIPFSGMQPLPGNVALHAIDGCGHMPHLEHPELSLRIVMELMRSAA